MKKFFEPFDVNPDPEHIDVPNYDRLGVITRITFPECQNSDTVRIHIAYWEEYAEQVKYSLVDYCSIYTYRKSAFQKFCDEFNLIQNGKLDLTNAISAACIIRFHPIYNDQLYPLLEDKAKNPIIEEILEKFENLNFTYGIKDIPELLQNYWYLPYCDEFYLLNNQHFGIISGLELHPLPNEDKKTIVYVTIFDDGAPRKYRYFLNSMYNAKYSDFLHTMGILEDSKEGIRKLLYKPVSIELYMANSGKTYVSSISKFKPLPSPEMKQAKMLLKAYSHYCINSKETNRDFTEI